MGRPVALESAVTAIESILPAGWSVKERVAEQVPYGHHWCDDYKGSKGTKLVIIGPRDVPVHIWTGDEWRAFPVARESLEIWVMPVQYHEKWFSLFCFHAPVPANEVASTPELRLFAKTSHVLLSEERFYELLRWGKGNAWPGSPENNPSLLSWGAWRQEVADVLWVRQ